MAFDLAAFHAGHVRFPTLLSRLFVFAYALATALVLATEPRAATEPALQRAAVQAVGADQGAYALAEDGTVLAAVNETRPVHPASVSKVATTLALLDRLGPDYRFETRFVAGRSPTGNDPDGDLVVESPGDPYFVFESALLVLAELRRSGLSGVEGGVRVNGPFMFNWQPDPSGSRLKNTLAGRDGIQVWPSVAAQRPELAGLTPASAALRFADHAPAPAHAPHTIVTYRSPRLRTIMKQLNCYSNNVFHPLSETIGGPQAVETITRERLPSSARGEIVVDNAAGAGLTNRMSPRAAVFLIAALQKEAAEHGLRLTDLLPVAGVDAGTLRDRVPAGEPAGALVGKTGTYGSIGVSSLAGVVKTRKYGHVTFAVLNKGLPVAAARDRQDAFVRVVMDAGEAERLPYEPDASALAQMEVVTKH